jgi:hypothetical protein
MDRFVRDYLSQYTALACFNPFFNNVFRVIAELREWLMLVGIATFRYILVRGFGRVFMGLIMCGIEGIVV